jgi:hypothetical protein
MVEDRLCVHRWLRRGLVSAAVAAAAVVLAVPASAGKASNAVSVSIPLPAAGQVQVSLVTLKVSSTGAARLKDLAVKATNASQLGSPQLNTQAVVAVTSGSGGLFKAYVFIHRFPSARRTASVGKAAALLAALAFSDKDDHVTGVKLVSLVKDLSCPVLERSGFFGDPKGSAEDFIYNLVVAFDTPAEVQLDTAVFAKCSSSTPPPENPNGPGEGGGK